MKVKNCHQLMKKKKNIVNSYIKNKNKRKLNTFHDKLILILKLLGKNRLVRLRACLKIFRDLCMEGLALGFG